MTVTFDAQSSSDLTASLATSFTDSTKMTVGTGSQRGMVALIGWGKGSGGGTNLPTSISLTWNGVAFQLVSNTALDQANFAAVSIYALLNPASGTQTFAGSWTGAADFTVSLVSFTGVDQTTFATSFINGTSASSASSGTASVTTNSAATDYTVAIFANDLTFGAISSGTQVYLDNSPTHMAGCGLRASGAAPNVTLGVASNAGWTGAGCDIVAAAITISLGIVGLGASEW